MSNTDHEREKRRCRAILTCAEAKGREGLARHLALETDVTLEQAKAVLTTTPTTSTATRRGGGFQWPSLGFHDDGWGGKSDHAASLAEVQARVYPARRKDCAEARAKASAPIV